VVVVDVVVATRVVDVVLEVVVERVVVVEDDVEATVALDVVPALDEPDDPPELDVPWQW